LPARRGAATPFAAGEWPLVEAEKEAGAPFEAVATGGGVRTSRVRISRSTSSEMVVGCAKRRLSQPSSSRCVSTTRRRGSPRAATDSCRVPRKFFCSQSRTNWLVTDNSIS
jgi:hypothetical protein